MVHICTRCGGSGWILRLFKKMTPLQQERKFSDSAFGKNLTRCTCCGGSGIQGAKLRIPFRAGPTI